jgi:hypothetical protein
LREVGSFWATSISFIFSTTPFSPIQKVTEAIENLRKLRGKQREEAEQKAAAAKKSPLEKQSSK